MRQAPSALRFFFSLSSCRTYFIVGVERARSRDAHYFSLRSTRLIDKRRFICILLTILIVVTLNLVLGFIKVVVRITSVFFPFFCVVSFFVCVVCFFSVYIPAKRTHLIYFDKLACRRCNNAFSLKSKCIISLTAIWNRFSWKFMCLWTLRSSAAA